MSLYLCVSLCMYPCVSVYISVCRCVSLCMYPCVSICVCVYLLTGQSEATAHVLLRLACCRGHREVSVLENEPHRTCDSEPLPPAPARPRSWNTGTHNSSHSLTHPPASLKLDQVLGRAVEDMGRSREEAGPKVSQGFSNALSFCPRPRRRGVTGGSRT